MAIITTTSIIHRNCWLKSLFFFAISGQLSQCLILFKHLCELIGTSQRPMLQHLTGVECGWPKISGYATPDQNIGNSVKYGSLPRTSAKSYNILDYTFFRTRLAMRSAHEGQEHFARCQEWLAFHLHDFGKSLKVLHLFPQLYPGSWFWISVHAQTSLQVVLGGRHFTPAFTVMNWAVDQVYCWNISDLRVGTQM